MKANIENSKVGPIVPNNYMESTGSVWIDITGLSPEPQSGWSYQNGVFSPPALDEIKTYKINLLTNVYNTQIVTVTNTLTSVFNSIIAEINSATTVDAVMSISFPFKPN